MAKANIISTPKQDYVRLKRSPRPGCPGVYDITPESLYLLVDAMSNGNIIDYVEYASIGPLFGVEPTISISRMLDFVYSIFHKEHYLEVIGNISITKIEDLQQYINGCPGFLKTPVKESLHKYISDNFDLVNGKFKRKPTSQYINN